MTSHLTTLTLYTRVGCHLCEQMKQQLEVLQKQYGFALNVVDIDADSFLKLRYSTKIPVLAVGEQELCHYQLLNQDFGRKIFQDFLK